MITEDELDTETGEVLSLDTTGENSAQVKMMVPCGNDCNGCPHGPYTYNVERDRDDMNWTYMGRKR